MKMKKCRNLKVYEQSGYQYRNIPVIMLKGKWLRELGFPIGSPITVLCEDDRIIITRTEVGTTGNPEQVSL